MYASALILSLCISYSKALPPAIGLVQRDNATLLGNSSLNGNSTGNSTSPPKGGVVVTPDPSKIFGDDQALLKDQEAKEKEIENGDKLDSVSGGWWEDIEDSALTLDNQTVSNITKSSFTFSNVTIHNVTASKSNSSKHSFSYDDYKLNNVTVLQRRKASSSLRKCLKDGKVPAIYEGDSDWNDYSRVYNQRRIYTPDVVVAPTSTDHVRDAVRCAEKADIKVQAKGGGHSYGSYSTGGRDGHMVVDLRKMDKIEVKPPSSSDGIGFATAGGGTRLGNLALALAEKGLAVPHGDCPAVGLAGHSLHGGFGYASRMWGLSTDSIAYMTVVTANGLVREVSDYDFDTRDLSWAFKGAGDSFGIVTEFWLRTQTAPKVVTRFSYDLSASYGNPSRMANYFLDTQKTLRESSAVDRNFGLTVRLSMGTYTIAGYYYGTRSDFRALRRELDKGMKDAPLEVIELKWNEALARIAGRMPVRQPRNSRLRTNFYAKSLLSQSSGIRSPNGLREYFTYIIAKGFRYPGEWVITFRLMGGRGSRVNDEYAAKKTSVSYRDSMWIIQHDGQTARNPRDMPRFIEGAHNAMQSNVKQDWKAFAPFLDPTLSNSEAHSQYFDEDTYKKLRSLKKIYDEDEMFWNPQSVKPRR